MISTQEVTKNIDKILSNLRPDLTFEYFSKHHDIGFGNFSGWDITICHEGRKLGEYVDGKCISGKWFDKEQEAIRFDQLYDKLSSEAKNQGIDFGLYLNNLLCKGKTAGGISWNEYNGLIFLARETKTE